MTAQVRVVHLAEEIFLRRAFRGLREPCCGHIGQDHIFGAGDLPDQGRALAERVGGVRHIRHGIAGGRDENDGYARFLGGADHRNPGRLDFFFGHAAVVERVIDEHEIGTVGQDIAGETLRSRRTRLAADRGDDHVEHGVRELFLQPHMGQMRVGLERPHIRRLVITRRYAVAVEDDVHRAVARPFFRKLRAQVIQRLLSSGCGQK